MRWTGQPWLVLSVVTLLGMPASAFGEGERPTVEPTTVEILTVLLDLEEIDDAGQEFSASIFVATRWNDPRLVFEGAKVERRGLHEIWHPRLQILNQREIIQTMPEIAEVAADGTVTYRQRILGKFSQRLDLGDFPLDTQTLTIQFVALGMAEHDIVFAGFPEGHSRMARDLSIADWKALEFRAGDRACQAVSGGLSLAGYALELDVKREFGYYGWKFLMPLVLIISMSWVVFWIGHEMANSRFSIAVTSMLTLIAYRFMVAGMLPRVSYLTRMDRFTVVGTALVFLTLIEVTVTSVLAGDGRQSKAFVVDRVSRWAFPLVFGIAILWAFVM